LAATPSVNTRLPLTRKRLGSDLPFTVRPSGKTIFLIAVGRWWMPPEAMVA
jgi:hypothetical protein